MEMLGNALDIDLPRDIDCPISIKELYVRSRPSRNDMPEVNERITINELGRLDPRLLLIILEQIIREAKIAVDYENDLLPPAQTRECYSMLKVIPIIATKVILDHLDLPRWDCHRNQLEVQLRVEIHDGKPDVALFYMGEYEEGDNYDHFRFLM